MTLITISLVYHNTKFLIQVVVDQLREELGFVPQSVAPTYRHSCENHSRLCSGVLLRCLYSSYPCIQVSRPRFVLHYFMQLSDAKYSFYAPNYSQIEEVVVISFVWKTQNYLIVIFSKEISRFFITFLRILNQNINC